MKRCRKCGNSKPLEDFSRLSKAADGRGTYCKACHYEYKKRWLVKNREQHNANRRASYERHAERERANRREYGRLNKDKEAAAARTYYEANAEKMNARRASWAKANRDKENAKARRRRARLLGAYVEDVDELILLEMDDGVCGICGEDVDPSDMHIDHIIPLARGGEHSYANTQIAHPMCNQRKHTQIDFTLAA